MNWFLSRGYEIYPECKIKKVIASDPEWEIYETNIGTYVLAVTPSLKTVWETKFTATTSMLLPDASKSYYVYISSPNYLIASLQQGPYPSAAMQIEAFAHAFKSLSMQRYYNEISDAIYLEEYSLLLPISSASSVDSSVLFGKWITGGVSIPITDTERICEFLSWMPVNALCQDIEIAGFEYHMPEQKDEDISNSSTQLAHKFRLIGRPELESFFIENIIDVVQNQEKYARMGIPFPGATVLHGPPGCGKTYAVDRVAEYLGWQRFDIDAGTVASPFIHDTSKKVSEVFTRAIAAAPSILVIDEMEAFLSDRANGSSSGNHHVEEVAEFLRRIPEAIEKGVLIFAMTNMIDQIDPAILRRGRFDHIIEVGMATTEEIQQLLDSKFRELPIDKEVCSSDIAKKLNKHPFSDVSFVLREAGRHAVKNSFETITQECFNTALEQLPKKKDRTPIGFLS